MSSPKLKVVGSPKQPTKRDRVASYETKFRALQTVADNEPGSETSNISPMVQLTTALTAPPEFQLERMYSGDPRIQKAKSQHPTVDYRKLSGQNLPKTTSTSSSGGMGRTVSRPPPGMEDEIPDPNLGKSRSVESVPERFKRAQSFNTGAPNRSVERRAFTMGALPDDGASTNAPNSPGKSTAKGDSPASSKGAGKLRMIGNKNATTLPISPAGNAGNSPQDFPLSSSAENTPRTQKNQPKLLERSSIPDPDQNTKLYFDDKIPTHMLCIRLPEELRELYYMCLYYLIDFRRYEKRRLQVMRQEQFHITIAAMHIETDAQLEKVKKWMGAQDWVEMFGEMDLEIGELALTQGPVVCCPMQTTSEQDATRLERAINLIIKNIEACGVVAKGPPRQEEFQLYMTLVKHRKSLRTFTWDRSFSSCELMRTLCQTGRLADYDWSKRAGDRAAVADVDMPPDVDEDFPIESIELCKINGEQKSMPTHQFYSTREIKDYYDIEMSRPCKLTMRVGNAQTLQMFMKEIEAETGKRLQKMTDEQLAEHEEHKRQRRIKLIEARKEENRRLKDEAQTVQTINVVDTNTGFAKGGKSPAGSTPTTPGGKFGASPKGKGKAGNKNGKNGVAFNFAASPPSSGMPQSGSRFPSASADTVGPLESDRFGGKKGKGKKAEPKRAFTMQRTMSFPAEQGYATGLADNAAGYKKPSSGYTKNAAPSGLTLPVNTPEPSMSTADAAAMMAQTQAMMAQMQQTQAMLAQMHAASTAGAMMPMAYAATPGYPAMMMPPPMFADPNYNMLYMQQQQQMAAGTTCAASSTTGEYDYFVDHNTHHTIPGQNYSCATSFPSTTTTCMYDYNHNNNYNCNFPQHLPTARCYVEEVVEPAPCKNDDPAVADLSVPFAGTETTGKTGGAKKKLPLCAQKVLVHDYRVEGNANEALTSVAAAGKNYHHCTSSTPTVSGAALPKKKGFFTPAGVEKSSKITDFDRAMKYIIATPPVAPTPLSCKQRTVSAAGENKEDPSPMQPRSAMKGYQFTDGACTTPRKVVRWADEEKTKDAEQEQTSEEQKACSEHDTKPACANEKGGAAAACRFMSKVHSSPSASCLAHDGTRDLRVVQTMGKKEKAASTSCGSKLDHNKASSGTSTAPALAKTQEILQKFGQECPVAFADLAAAHVELAAFTNNLMSQMQERATFVEERNAEEDQGRLEDVESHPVENVHQDRDEQAAPPGMLSLKLYSPSNAANEQAPARGRNKPHGRSAVRDVACCTPQNLGTTNQLFSAHNGEEHEGSTGPHTATGKRSPRFFPTSALGRKKTGTALKHKGTLGTEKRSRTSPLPVFLLPEAVVGNGIKERELLQEPRGSSRKVDYSAFSGCASISDHSGAGLF
ncbi:unnamed protein product [Amoebophrya sp. A120]|nr:unnamed protein product [Amoebophrya sp. A120]|eukprot:GSA120T00002746001.1